MEGKVALVTGAARGQGRSHAVRLAEEGCDIIAVDICDQVGSVGYQMGTADDLAQTAKLVENLDRRIVTRKCDARDSGQLNAAVAEGVSEFGAINVAVINHGILSAGISWELDDTTWQDMIDVNLTSYWKSCKAIIPHMIEQGNGGSIVMTSSVAGMRGYPMISHYVAAKHGVIGLMRSLVNELAPHRIRVNTVHPTSVETSMITNDTVYNMFGATDLEGVKPVLLSMNALEIPWVDPVDISNAVLFLASDEARYVTGLTLYVDAGFLTKVP
jgi:SDR family mycofactocin-dependent oxidoreductase